jgi:hypothetical protein
MTLPISLPSVPRAFVAALVSSVAIASAVIAPSTLAQQSGVTATTPVCPSGYELLADFCFSPATGDIVLAESAARNSTDRAQEKHAPLPK